MVLSLCQTSKLKEWMADYMVKLLDAVMVINTIKLNRTWARLCCIFNAINIDKGVVLLSIPTTPMRLKNIWGWFIEMVPIIMFLWGVWLWLSTDWLYKVFWKSTSSTNPYFWRQRIWARLYTWLYINVRNQICYKWCNFSSISFLEFLYVV